MEIEIPEDGTVAFIAPRGRGKSVIIKDLCERVHRNYPLVVVMCPTAFNGWYQGWIPPELLFDSYRENIILQLMARNKRLIDANKPLEAKDRVDVRTLLILDDCVSETEAQHSPALQRLFTTGRHYKIAVWISSQHATAKSLPPILRVNLDLIFVSAQSSQAVSDLITEQWLTGASTKHEAEAYLHHITRSGEPFTFMYIDATKAATARSLPEFCTPFRARIDLPKFRMGAQRFWSGMLIQKTVDTDSWLDRLKHLIGL